MSAADELVFAISTDGATRATPISLAEAGFRERDDLQEWVLDHPEILGEDVLVVAFEFDNWQSTSGARPRDRLDILGLDTDGTLVVAELKRDEAPDTVEMQAVKYAAMASRFQPDVLAAHHARFLQARTGHDVSDEEAMLLLDEHTIDPLEIDALRQPRIVLVAGSFKPTTMASVVWLNEMGVDIRLVQTRAYRVGAEVILTASPTYPPPATEDFAIAPRLPKRGQVREAREHRREASVVKRLVAAAALPDGASVTFQRGERRGGIDEEAIRRWQESDPLRSQVHWVNDTARPLVWAVDGERYAPATLARLVLREALGIEFDALRGPYWWAVEDGRSLVEVAESVAPSTDVRAKRDWSDLHRIMSALPLGKWTTYGDLAEVIGSHANPVGQHIASYSDVENAWRVLRSDGQVAEGFRWSDPDESRTVQAVLESEGIRFENGRAEPTQRLSTQELRRLAGG